MSTSTYKQYMDETLNDSNLTAEQRRKLLTTWLQFDEYLKKLDRPEDPWGYEYDPVDALGRWERAEQMQGMI